jgi:AbiV family abortive infection protein
VSKNKKKKSQTDGGAIPPKVQSSAPPLEFGKMVSQSPYAGHLKAAQIAQGINLARQNGKRLVADAKLLLAEKRYPSAAALAVLAIEEQGKELVLRRLALVHPTDKTATFWRDFRNHLQKNKAWILPFLGAQLPGATLEDLHAAIFDEDSNHSEVLDWVKQAAFYTDCVGNGQWQSPDQILDEWHTAKLVEIADVMQGSRGDITEEEIEESQEMIRSGTTREKIQAYQDKYGHKGVLPIM